MSRFGPGYHVENRSADLISQAISGALDSYTSGKERKRAQGQADEDRSRAQTVQNIGLAKEGVHLQKPGELPPRFDINVSGGPTPQNAQDIMDRAIRPALGGSPLERASDAATLPPVAPIAPLTATPSRNLTVGDGYYVDQDERNAAVARDAKTHFQSIVSDALAKGQADELVNPGGKASEREYKAALTKQAIAQALKAGEPTYHPPAHIDPLSPEGIAATRGLKAFEANLKPPKDPSSYRPNEANLKNAAFANIARNEDPALKDMATTAGSTVLGRLPIVGNMILSHTDPKYQSQQLAGDRWIMQWLRSTSGAAIGNDELTNYRKQYIPQPGDTPETLAGKESARADVERSLDMMAGPAGVAPTAPRGTPRTTHQPLGIGQRPGTVQPQQGNAPPGDVNLGGDTPRAKRVVINGKPYLVPE